MATEENRPALATLLACFGACAVACFLLWAPITTFRNGLWGPEHPWLHRDFLGAIWLFWAETRPEDWLGRLDWPMGALPLVHHIPNPFDAWILGPLVAHLPFPLWWNGMQLGHHLANVSAATWLCRSTGARWPSALAGGALVAASPVMLHEIAGGRTLSGALWPGLVGLGLLARHRPGWAGLAIGLQGLCYLYSGLAVGIVALIVRPHRRLWTAALPMVPYAVWLWPLLTSLHPRPAPTGPTALPMAGLLGLAGPPDRQLLLGGLILGFLAVIWAPTARRWVVAAAVVLFLALGPTPTWAGGAPIFTSPIALVQEVLPGLDRLHHPIRMALLGVPLLALGIAHLLDRLPRWGALLAIAWALSARVSVQATAAWAASPVPPGAEAARFLQGVATGIVDLTGQDGEALALQPLHQAPLLEGLRRRSPAPDDTTAHLRDQVNGWLTGTPQPDLARQLRRNGFSHVLAIPRRHPLDTTGLEADLGSPIAPYVYALPP